MTDRRWREEGLHQIAPYQYLLGTMNHHSPEQHSYEQPRLHPNLVLSSLQLLAWILFRPSAWRDYITRIDPTLQPDCTLLDIKLQSTVRIS